MDFALATECLPSEHSRGTDLAVWGLSSTLPLAIAGPIGGLMLDNGQVRSSPRVAAWDSILPCCEQRIGHSLGVTNLGYVGLFVSCAMLLAISAVFVCFITVGNPRNTRKDKQQPGTLMISSMEMLQV